MSGTLLKILAASSMLVDHIGAIFFPQYSIFRIIGRTSFPLFAFLLAQGFLHTSSRKKYAFRLGITALIAEIPFDLALTGQIFSWNKQNVCFTLLLGFLNLCIVESTLHTQPVVGLFSSVLLCGIAQLLHFDYGWYGVLLILLFFVCRENLRYSLSSFVLLNTGYALIYSNTQLYAAASLFPLICYNGKRGCLHLKYFFYLFYPGHLLLLGLCRCIL